MSSTAAGSSNSSRYLDFDEYVDLKLQKTRATIKSTDILVALAGVAAMFLGYLLLFVVFDQWIVPGGFGIGLRWTLLSTLLVLTAAWLGWKVGVPYLRSVNRLFAAQEIEKSDPDLKSNLLNLVDLRSSGRAVDPAILRALEKNAAVGLQKIDVAQAIDHRPLMRMAYILLAVVVMFCLYALLSPKKISNSIWRSLLPAAELGVSTRTEIMNVQPGDQTVLARQTVLVSADIAGDVPEKVWMHYTTADGKFRDEPVELRTDGEGPTRFKGSLPSVLQDLTYVVRAGDAVSREYHITVKQPPSATVDRIGIQFPAYMKLEATEQAGGQIDSWEGTKVTLTARTNMPVKSATIEFYDTPPQPNDKVRPEEVSLSVSSDGRQLTASWSLGFSSDGTYAKIYRIQCKTEAGESDPSPIQYGLNIRPDLPPEVSLLEPVRDLEVPANAVIPLLIEARDPDFELSHINLHVKKNGQPVHKEPLSDGRQQRLLLKHDLKLERLVLQTGDVVEIWVQAFDNKQPRPNSKVTPELKLKIVDRVSDKEVKEKLAEAQANREQKLKETEQEQNPDRSEQQPPKDQSEEQRQRDPQDPNRNAQEPMPPKPDQAGNDPANNPQKQEGGKPKSEGNKPGQDTQKGGQGQQNASTTGEQGKHGEQPLSPDGEDDQKALETFINELNQKKDRKQPDQSSQETTAKKDRSTEQNPDPSNSGNDPQPNGGAPGPKQPMPGTDDGASPNVPKSPKKTDPSGNKPGPDKPDTGTQPMPTEAGPRKDESKPPMPGGDGTTKPEGTTKPNETKKPEGGKTTPPDTSTPGNPSATTPKDKSSDSTEETDPKPGEGTKPVEPPKSDRTNEGTKPTTKPMPGKPGTEPQPGEQAEKKPGAQEGTGSSPEKPKPDPAKPPKAGADKQGGQGSGTESKPSTKPGAGDEKKGPAEGPQEPAPESPNAERKNPDGTEKGVGKPDNDPAAKPMPSNNPDVVRDPKDKPATRPGESKPDDPKPSGTSPSDNQDNPKQKPGTKPGDAKPNDPVNPAKRPSDNEVKTPKPQATGTEKQKIDQQDDGEQKAPPGKNPEKRQGDSNAADEKLKGPGEKNQRSKQGSGGQGGSSKEDKEGNPGSQTQGEGDTTNRPGSDQPTDKKADPQSGGKKTAGEGSKADEGTKKPGSGGSKEEAGKPGAEPGKGGQKQGAEGGKEGAPQEGGEGGEGAGQGQGKPGGKPGGKGQPGQGAGQQGKRAPAGGGQAGANSEGASANGGSGSADDGEEANLEFKKQATELVLKRLQDGLERGDIDPELLEKLGWTQDEMRRFTERLSKHLQDAKSGDETPESQTRRQQFEEMLKSLDVNKRGTTRQGDKAAQREVNQIESHRATVPREYRGAYEKFSREITRQKTKPAPK